MNPEKTEKKMYKVLAPIEKKGGGTYWMRLGTAFTNRDDSLNLYLDAIPAPNGKSHRFELHIRELTDDDLRRRDSHGASGGSGGGGSYGTDGGPTGYGRDLGGVGGGPTTRAVTSASGSEDGVPF